MILAGHSMKDRPCKACGDLDGCRHWRRLRDNKLTLEEFWYHHALWSQKTFGFDRNRGPEGPLKHLKKEIEKELLGPDGNLYDLEEYADLIFLAFDACRRAGFTFEQLRVAVNEKLKINKDRKWPKGVPSDQPIEHIREET